MKTFFFKQGLILLFIVTNVQTSKLSAQTIQIIGATSQGWAGGICCRTGVNYNIHLKIIQNKLPIILDTLWLEGYGKDLSSYNKPKVKSHDTLSIQIKTGISFDDGMPDFIQGSGDYDGSIQGVLLYYHIDKKKMVLAISPFIKELEFIAYP